jgi:uncharacterized YigZ family protein
MQTILQAGSAEQTINKSRFIAVAEHAEDERAAVHCIMHLAQRYRDASHIAFAFRIKTPQGIVQRFNDAGEPSGTAGKPILQYLEGQELINICVAVVRYYGGINLGTGGLARAYGGTAKQAVEAASRGPYVEMGRLRLRLDYADFDLFTRELTRVNGAILDKQFAEHVDVVVSVPVEAAEPLKQRFAK